MTCQRSEGVLRERKPSDCEAREAVGSSQKTFALGTPEIDRQLLSRDGKFLRAVSCYTTSALTTKYPTEEAAVAVATRNEQVSAQS